MKSKTKHILFASALLIIGAIMLTSDKINRLMAIFQKISFKPASFMKNVQFSNPNELSLPQNFSFLIDLKVINPDFESFTASGLGVAKLRTVDFYLQTTHIGTAIVDLEDIDIPAESEYILKNLKVTGKTLSILSNAPSLIDLKLTDLRFIATIEVLGIDYEIGN